MKQSKSSSKDEAITPPSQPSVTPRDIGYSHDFVLGAIMENQRTLGELKEAITSLKSSTEKQSVKLDKHGNIIAAASAATLIVLVIFGFLMDKMWDKIALFIGEPITHSITSAPDIPATKAEPEKH